MVQKKQSKQALTRKKTKKTIDIAGIIWKEAYNIRLTADAKYNCMMNQR